MLGKFAQTDKKDDKSRDVCKQIAAFQCIKYDRLFFFLKPLDALDERFQMAAVERIGAHGFRLSFSG